MYSFACSCDGPVEKTCRFAESFDFIFGQEVLVQFVNECLVC